MTIKNTKFHIYTEDKQYSNNTNNSATNSNVEFYNSFIDSTFNLNIIVIIGCLL